MKPPALQRGYRSGMRTRAVIMLVAGSVSGPGLVGLRAVPASAKSISAPNLKNLTNTINNAKKLTYYAQYTAVSNGAEVDRDHRPGATEVVLPSRRAAT